MSRYIDRAELFNRLSDVKTLAAAMAVIQDMPAAETKNVPDTNVGDMISRQAAIDAICKHGTDLERRGITVLAVSNHKQTTVDLLEQLPSAERRGRWELEKEFKYKRGGRNTEAKQIFGTEWRTMQRLKCSVCGMVVLVDDTIKYEYCPHCGAKMDEVTEE